MARIIFHIDLNSFFASCEIANDKTLKGKPVVVAGNARRGVILTASYEARAYGIRSAMPLFQAEKLCSNLIIKKPNMSLYKDYSIKFFNVISKYCKTYEKGSIDEAYVDVTVESKNYVNPVELAEVIQKELLTEYKLPCSIGIAPNKFLAKMASDMKKPLGITILRKRDVKEKLWPLDIEDMFGVGKKTFPKLKAMGIHTIGDLVNFKDQNRLKTLFKSRYESVINNANGINYSEVSSKDYDDIQQIGNSSTFQKDTNDLNEIKDKYYKIVNTVISRMKNKNVASKTFTIKITFFNHKTITRAVSLTDYIFDIDDILSVADSLLNNHYNGEYIRLIGFSTGALIKKRDIIKQLDLFSYHEEKKPTHIKLAQDINKKFGSESIVLAKNIKDNK